MIHEIGIPTVRAARYRCRQMVSGGNPKTREASWMLIPATITARRTRSCTSIWDALAPRFIPSGQPEFKTFPCLPKARSSLSLSHTKPARVSSTAGWLRYAFLGSGLPSPLVLLSCVDMNES